jgi:hypothetical protein
MEARFYEFRQNNSGGSFDVDNNVCKWMFIEANDCEQANELAQNLGVYFNGCDSGLDCDCCGDRWHEADESGYINLKEVSKSYKTKLTTIEDYANLLVDKYGWGENEFARVFYLSGERNQVNKKELT